MRTWTITAKVVAATALASVGTAAAAVTTDQEAAPEFERAAAEIGAVEIGAGVDAEIDAEIAPAKLERGAALSGLTPVDSIPALGRLHSWSVVDDDTLIIWATPFRPYLVELFRPSPELRFAVSIGVTSFGSRIHAKFDAVEVDGFSYPIERIYEMSRDEAEAAKATS